MTSLHPAAAGLDYCAEIALHSAALADAAEGNLTAPVEHCPGWTVADLVDHVREVHWFWAYLAEHRPASPPEDVQGPPRPADDQLIEQFRTGALHLVATLRRADPTAAAWTWAPTEHNVGFIERHQVQEAAVHRWDAEHAAGRSVELGTAMSVDAVEEFLTFSVANMDDQPPEPRPALDGALVLKATDADAQWTATDAEIPGTVRMQRGAVTGAPVLAGTASELLLWLYRRVELAVPVNAGELVPRFRALTFTD
jgi:uncharacterized protein (TIGR03083 family)